MILIIIAGFPTAIAPAGIFLVITAFAPIIADFPIETPGRIVALSPIHTLSLIITVCLWIQDFYLLEVRQFLILKETHGNYR